MYLYEGANTENLVMKYVYKYVANTIPGDRLLEKDNYDRTIKYNRITYIILIHIVFMYNYWDHH